MAFWLKVAFWCGLLLWPSGVTFCYGPPSGVVAFWCGGLLVWWPSGVAFCYDILVESEVSVSMVDKWAIYIPLECFLVNTFLFSNEK